MTIKEKLLLMKQNERLNAERVKAYLEALKKG